MHVEHSRLRTKVYVNAWRNFSMLYMHISRGYLSLAAIWKENLKYNEIRESLENMHWKGIQFVI